MMRKFITEKLAVLGLAPTDEGRLPALREIRRSWVRNARRFHSDRHAGDDADTQAMNMDEMQKVNSAWEVLEAFHKVAAGDQGDEYTVREIIEAYEATECIAGLKDLAVALISDMGYDFWS